MDDTATIPVGIGIYEVCRARRCRAQARSRGYCPRHYQQVRRYGMLLPFEREYRRRGSSCTVANCAESQTAKGYCFRHYQQIRRHGRLTPERERIYGRTQCRVSGCAEKHSARGFCRHHYNVSYFTLRSEGFRLREAPALAAVAAISG